MNTTDCAPCCVVTPPVNIPGVEGPSGTGEQGPPGADGAPYEFDLTGVLQGGTPYVLTATPAVISGMNLTLPTAGTWMMFATVELDLSSVTYAAQHTVTITVRRINDNTNIISRDFTVPIVTSATSVLSNVVIPISYVASTTADELELWASVDTLPDNAPTGQIQAKNPRLELFRLFV